MAGSEEKMSGITSKKWINRMFGRGSESTKNEENPIAKKEDEEWIWVDGFKGTDKNMRCKGYQFELGKVFEMPDDKTIRECKSGFHLCLTLSDVYGYYQIGHGHRFFAVRALVRKEDLDMYGKWISSSPDGYSMCGHRKDKIVAKAIEFVRELTADEIFADCPCYEDVIKNFTDEQKAMAIVISLDFAVENYRITTLMGLGFTKALATYIVHTDRLNIAMAVGSQPDLSMDVKCQLIFGGEKDHD